MNLCDKPEDIEPMRILCFFKVAKYIATQEGYSDDRWCRDVLANMNFPGNDCYITWYISTDRYGDGDSESVKTLRQFDAGLMKYFDLQEDDKILLRISW